MISQDQEGVAELVSRNWGLFTLCERGSEHPLDVLSGIAHVLAVGATSAVFAFIFANLSGT